MLFPNSILHIYDEGVRTGIINGCGQKGSFSFSDLFYRLESMPNFIPVKGKECFYEIEKGCGYHDILCEFGGSRSMKLFADLWFTDYVRSRVSWVAWYYRIPFCVGLFIGLHFKGKDAGNFS